MKLGSSRAGLPLKDAKPRVIDLFAGVGGLSLGAVRAGFNLALAVELDKHAIQAHTANFPSNAHLEKDIGSLDGPALLSAAKLAAGQLDGMIGGPPCQGFSAIGKRCKNDPRNSLFRKFFQLVAECEPKFFVAENVPGILDDAYSDLRSDAFSLVGDEYTLLEPMALKASDFGAATSRERVFFIGYRAGTMRALTKRDFELKKVKDATNVADALMGLPSRIRDEWLFEDQGWRRVDGVPQTDFGTRIAGLIPEGIGDAEAVRRYREKGLTSGCLGTRHTPAVRARYSALKPGGQDEISKSVRLVLEGLCPTLRAGTGSDKGSYQAVRPIHPTAPRVITPREAARLQGFPDWFRFAPSKWHSFRQIGNSVSPFVAESVLSVLFSCLRGPTPQPLE
jgi:DNA (cytosine-5)-methyltransferase 1